MWVLERQGVRLSPRLQGRRVPEGGRGTLGLLFGGKVRKVRCGRGRGSEMSWKGGRDAG